MSIYTLDQLITPPGEPEVLGLKLTERSIYGSSRVGTENPDLLIARTDVSLLHEFDYVQTVGDRRYELSNHLGNVLNVVTDRKLPVEDVGLPGEVDYYIADVASQNDYYPGGSLLPNRCETAGDQYRYGFNGYEADDEIKGERNSYTTEFRQYDPRVFRWLSIDPIVKTHESPYMAYSGNPIWFADPKGADSTLAAGSTTWKWNVEAGDTYSSISERTGTSVENLRKWNGYADKKIPVGASLHISDPTAPPSTTIPNITVDVGTISINRYETNYSPETVRRLTLSMDFTPNAANSGSEFVWFQTYENNDPTTTQRGGEKLYNKRLLWDEPFYGLDADSGMRNARNTGAAKQYQVPLYFDGDFAFLDSPGRGISDDGVVTWNSTITLLQKTNSGYVAVTTVYFSFEVHPDGSTVMTSGEEIDGTFIPGNLKIGTNFDTEGGAYKYHMQELQKWIDTH